MENLNLPKFSNYGNYSSDNYGVHCLVFTDSFNNSFYFSYQTLVAFKTAKTGLVIRENAWGNTTGKHLNWIDTDKKKRVSKEVFEKRYNEAFKKEKVIFKPNFELV